MSTCVPLALACGDYDRTQGLRDGRVRPEGVELTYIDLPVEEIFFRMARYQEFDAAEMSLSSYVLSHFQGAPFVAIPVFPSRAFRHNGVYVSAASDIHEPADLVGRTVGVPEYQMTAAVWIRGILAEHHDVPVPAVRYRTGGLHEPGRVEKLPIPQPPGVEIEPIRAEQTLAQMLVDGELDALYSARTPWPFAEGHPAVRRMFSDPRGREEEYFARTGIFPIMHTVVLRRDVYEKRPWLARSLYKAFEEARSETAGRLTEMAALRYMLPWYYEEVERNHRLMGRDYWPYGLEANEATLRTFLRYSYEQGLAERLLDPADLFARETLDSYLI
ncbi:MAG: ABC transporter substrate-binding protein [Streptosporangiales bacterium]|nr:ABC transporter substrate-binding protein [Streptosporangiales bacterium]